jgi:hypothetical protein
VNRLDELTRAAQEATEIHNYQTDPDVIRAVGLVATYFTHAESYLLALTEPASARGTATPGETEVPR